MQLPPANRAAGPGASRLSNAILVSPRLARQLTGLPKLILARSGVLLLERESQQFIELENPVQFLFLTQPSTKQTTDLTLALVAF
jgi:hypothetical protein